MGWLDAPFMDMVEYFLGTMSYFIDIARKLAWVISILAMIWNCIQIVFGTMEVQKMAISTITKFTMFLLIINVYPAVCSSVMHFSQTLGQNGSGNAEQTVEKIMTDLMQEARSVLSEFDLLQVDSGNKASFADLRRQKTKEDEVNKRVMELDERIKSLDTEISRTKMTAQYGNTAGHSKNNRITQADIQNSKLEASKELEELKEQRKQLKAEAMQTLSEYEKVNGKGSKEEKAKALQRIETLSKILVKNKNDISSSYALDLRITNLDGKKLPYISPNAMMSMALLSADYIWEKEWTSVNAEWDQNIEDSYLGLSIIEFPFRRIVDILLTGICCIALIFCTIFSLCQYIMCVIEFAITCSFSVMFVPCLLFDGLKEYANNVIKSILAQTIKLAMIIYCLFFAIWAYANLAVNTISSTEATLSLTTFAYVMFVILVSFSLTQNAPKLAIAILNGSPQMSMGELMMAAGTAAAVGVGMKEVGAWAGDKAKKISSSAVGLISGVSGAGKAGVQNAKDAGKGIMGQSLSAVGHGFSELGHRGKQHVKSALHEAGHKQSHGQSALANFTNAIQGKGVAHGYGGGGGAGGTGSGGGVGGGKRFGASNNDSAMDINGNQLDSTKVSPENYYSMAYENSRNEKGQSSTMREFAGIQHGDAYNRHRKPMPKAEPEVAPSQPTQSPALGISDGGRSGQLGITDGREYMPTTSNGNAPKTGGGGGGNAQARPTNTGETVTQFGDFGNGQNVKMTDKSGGVVMGRLSNVTYTPRGGQSVKIDNKNLSGISGASNANTERGKEV